MTPGLPTEPLRGHASQQDAGMDYDLTKKVLAALEREGVNTIRPKDWGDAQRIASRFGWKE